jgi:hypothetical protein
MSDEKKPPRTKAEEAESKRKAKEREKEQAHLFTDDTPDAGDEVNTRRVYVSRIPVGQGITGVYVSMEVGKDLDGNPRKRPMILTAGDEFVVLPSHTQLLAAFQRIKPGSSVSVVCKEKVELAGGRTAWNYRVTAAEPSGDLPF